jgi:hypothetical protein
MLQERSAIACPVSGYFIGSLPGFLRVAVRQYRQNDFSDILQSVTFTVRRKARESHCHYFWSFFDVVGFGFLCLFLAFLAVSWAEIATAVVVRRARPSMSVISFFIGTSPFGEQRPSLHRKAQGTLIKTFIPVCC